MVEYNEKFTSLNKINLSIDSLKSFNLFKQFADKYNQKITSIELRLNFSTFFKEINDTLKAIASFNQISNISLTLKSKTPIKLDINIFSKLLAKNCPKLQSLDLELRGELTMKDNYLFKHLQQLSSLKTLDIKIKLNDESIKLEPFSSQKSKSFKCLTHLHILYWNLSDDYLSNIHLYCPKLESIELKTAKSYLLSDQSLHYLVKLKQLKRLIIFGPPYRMTKISDSGVCSLIANCRQLNRIEFNCGIAISDPTFEALKQLANSSPKRVIEFKFCWEISSEQRKSLNVKKRLNAVSAARFWPILKELPNNLRITDREYYGENGQKGLRPHQIRHYLDQFYKVKDTDN